jgi:hypothetical protein
MRHPLKLLTLGLLLAPACLAWGVLGHRLVAATALLDLPPEAAEWFRGQEATVAAHASEPDSWKDTDPLEPFRHFIHCEPYGGAGLVPREEDAARAVLGDDLFRVSGQVPWVIPEREDRLAAAFGTGDSARVALEASWLSHYVGDLHVPLHTTVDHDGACPGQKGLHHRWETGIPERLLARGWEPVACTALPSADPAGAPFSWLLESHALVPGLLEDDTRASRLDGAGNESHGKAYWTVFLRLQGPRVETQIERAAQATATAILNAWVQAGRPSPPPK